MRITKARRKLLAEAGRKGGQSRSEAKIAAVRANGRKHVARVRSLAEIVAEEAAKFKLAHPELFEV
jgi:hypothetical protein